MPTHPPDRPGHRTPGGIVPAGTTPRPGNHDGARFGDMLLATGSITPAQLNAALATQRQQGGLLGEILLQHGAIDEGKWLEILHAKYNAPIANLIEFSLTETDLRRSADALGREFCERHVCVPFGTSGAKIMVAFADPSDIEAQDLVHSMTGRGVEACIATAARIREAIERLFATPAEAPLDLDAASEIPLEEVVDEEDAPAAALEREAADAPIVKLVNAVLLEAVRRRASDIHLKAYPRSLELVLSYRVDGALQRVRMLPWKTRRAIVSRLKIMAALDIAERRRPQDGRIRLKSGSAELEFRLSILPTARGEEGIVLRVLDKSQVEFDIAKLGFDPPQLVQFRQALDEQNGIILVTGPTGSGKTTTLYSALAHLNDGSLSIETAEDPIEAEFTGIEQSQINEDIHYGFPDALRSMLRHDPDVILVGEIRDYATLEVALKAAQTGHLVLSTIHTNDAASTVTRLVDLGAESFLLADTLRCVVAQRLVRRLCERCRAPVSDADAGFISAQLMEYETIECDLEGATFFRPGTCNECGGTGFRGRAAIHELLPITGDIQHAITERLPASELRASAIAGGMRSVRQSGFREVCRGVTTVEEVLRNTSSR